MEFVDGLMNVFNRVLNKRNQLTQNRFAQHVLPYDQQRALYRMGLGSKIVRIKAGYALKDTIQFENSNDADVYERKLSKKVKLAAQYMLAFGRGLIVIHTRGENLSEPLKKPIDVDDVRLSVFSGDLLTVQAVSVDLHDPRYMMPMIYNVRGFAIHPSRVVDMCYVKPVEYDLPQYYYGGISEFELIYNQLVSDGIVERACPAILEKNSSWIYKVAGFKDAMRSKQDDAMVNYFSRIEDMRSIYGATVMDKDDEVQALSQVLTNLSDVDQISLRRLAMVTGIPVSILVGENVRGLNSSGESERTTFQDTEEALQSGYLLDPINELMGIFGLGRIKFKDNQGETPTDRIKYDAVAIDNAFKLWQMGEDYSKYLEQKNVVEPDNWADLWGEDEA